MSFVQLMYTVKKRFVCNYKKRLYKGGLVDLFRICQKIKEII